MSWQLHSRVKHDDYYAMHTYVYDAMRKKYYIFETREQNKISNYIIK